VITGAAGVGKTTLAMTGLRVAEKRGMSVARAAATWASRGLPFGALAPFLPPDPGGDGLGREDRGELLRRYGRSLIFASRAESSQVGLRPGLLVLAQPLPADRGSRRGVRRWSPRRYRPPGRHRRRCPRRRAPPRTWFSVVGELRADWRGGEARGWRLAVGAVRDYVPGN
jgi:hypothetical protein